MIYWRGPNTEADGKTAYNNVRVGRPPTQRNWNSNFYRQCKLAGPQHREIGTPISTGNASWGRTEINFAKITFLFQSRDVKILRKNNATNYV